MSVCVEYLRSKVERLEFIDSTLLHETINPTSAQHMIPRKNIRVPRGHEDRGGMAISKIRMADFFLRSPFRRRTGGIIARLSTRTKVGNFEDDFFMTVLGLKD